MKKTVLLLATLSLLIVFGGCQKTANCKLTAHASVDSATAMAGNPVHFTLATSNESGNSTYDWLGPDGYVSHEKNPVLEYPGVNSSGLYIGTVHSGECQAQSTVSIKISPVSVPCKVRTNWMSGSSSFPDWSFYTVDCGHNYSWGYFMMTGNSQKGDLTIEFKDSTSPKANRIYRVVPYNDDHYLMQDYDVMVHGSGGGVFSENLYVEEGKVYVDVINGKITASFCDLEFKGQYSQFTSSGNLTCRK